MFPKEDYEKEAGSVMYHLSEGIKRCIDKGKYGEAAQLGTSYGSILSALGLLLKADEETT